MNVYCDPAGRTLTVWFGRPQAEYVCEEPGEEVVLMKDRKGRVIGFERLNYPGKAERYYARHDHFRKLMRGRGNAPRDWLYAFMRRCWTWIGPTSISVCRKILTSGTGCPRGSIRSSDSKPRTAVVG